MGVSFLSSTALIRALDAKLRLKISGFLNVCQKGMDLKTKIVPTAGFKPTTPGTQVRCSND